MGGIRLSFLLASFLACRLACSCAVFLETQGQANAPVPVLLLLA